MHLLPKGATMRSWRKGSVSAFQADGDSSNLLLRSKCPGDGTGIHTWFKIKVLQVRILAGVQIAQIAQTEEQESSKF